MKLEGERLEGERLEKAKALRDRLAREGKGRGYNLNPDESMTVPLCDGLLVNEGRYGYMACPCRLAAGEREDDLDVICPCDYRDDDLAEFGACYCGLYVSDEVAAGKRKTGSIPERRMDRREKAAAEAKPGAGGEGAGTHARRPRGEERAGEHARRPRVWRCKVCGYLSAMEHAPGRCPICGADHDRFEPFDL